VDIAGILKDIPPRPMGPGRPVDELRVPEHPLLAKDKVCYVGQPIAILVAKDPYIARDGLDLISVDYEPLTPVIDPLVALDVKAPIVHQAWDSNVAMRLRQQGGDLEAAFAQADHIIHQCYQLQRVAPSPAEGRGVLALYQPQADQLTIWDSTQAPHRVRTYLARLLNRAENTIRVIAPDVGGSFGVKDCLFPEDFLIPYLALLLEKPIKWSETRQENLLTYHGRGQSAEVEIAVRRDGVMLGIRAHVVADLGAYFLLTTPFAPFNTCRRINGPYHVPAISTELVAVVTNKTPIGAYRGTGSPEAAFYMERSIDLIAHDLGLDPAEVRRKNYIPTDAFPYHSATGATYDSGDYELALDRALQLVDYKSWRQKAKQRQPHEPLLGLGLSTFIKSSGASGEHRHEHARVHIEPSGQVTVYTGISPHGQGSETSFAQIAAQELGVHPSQVRVWHGDTSIFPTGEGTSASRGLIIGGSAVYAVLQEALQKLSLVAAPLLACSAEDIGFQEGRIFNRHKPDAAMPFTEIVAVAYDEARLPGNLETGLDFSASYTLPSNPFSFGAHAAVVEVSRHTGEVNILRYVGVHDCGRIINPMIVEGQILGGIAQGVGQALYEGIVYSESGQPLNGSLQDYAMPRSTWSPELILETMDTYSPTNPLGAKGIGSVSTVPSPAAVTNAVLDALSSLGVHHLDMPLTAEKVWRAMQQGGA
jgi:carbon-monoxide dehydrogenase large subunit